MVRGRDNMAEEPYLIPAGDLNNHSNLIVPPVPPHSRDCFHGDLLIPHNSQENQGQDLVIAAQSGLGDNLPVRGYCKGVPWQLSHAQEQMLAPDPNSGQASASRAIFKLQTQGWCFGERCFQEH